MTAPLAESVSGGLATAGRTAGKVGAAKGAAGKVWQTSQAGQAQAWGRRRYDQATGPSGRSKPTKIILAELVVCAAIIGLSPIVNDKITGRDFMKRGTATLAVFMVLGLLSSVGPKAGKVAAGFGGLMVVAILIDQRSLFGKLVDILNAGPVEKGIRGPSEETAIDKGFGTN